MAYSRTSWLTGDPITQERMNNIEDGINEALALSSRISAAQSTANNASSIATTNSGKITQLESSLASLETDANQATDNAREAIGQILGATTENNPQYDNLDTRFEVDEGRIGNAEGDIELLSGQLDAARVRTNGAGVVTRTFNNITDRLNNTDITLDTHYGYISTLQSDYDAAKGGNAYPTLNARISADEKNFQDLYNEVDAARKSNGTLKNHFDDIDDAITAATQSAAKNTTYGSMDARFEAIETELVSARNGQTDLDTRLDAIDSANVNGSIINRVSTLESNGGTMSTTLGTVEGRVSALEGNRVRYDEVRDDLTHTDTNKPLSANQGKELKGLIDAMDTAYKAEDTALGGRVTTIEGDLNTATTGLKARMSTAESDIDALESALDTAETGVKARITALETTVNTSTTGLSDRMTTAESAISHAAEGNDPGGLTERLTAVEGDINNVSNGIKTRLDAIDNTSNGALKALDDRLDALDGGTALDTTGGTLGARVTTLEGKDTIIVSYDGEHSNYTEGTPNLNSPSENADYLIADDEGKYFYWRYFGAVTGWQLVGGAGGEGGGTGSSSGVILSVLPSVETGDPNIDYFIGTDETGYTYYRFVPAEQDESSGHFIRILPNNLITDLSVDAYGGLVAHTVDNDQTNVLSSFYALKGVTYTPNYDPNDANTLVSQTLQFTRTDGETLDPIVIVGGGGGSGSAYTVNIESTTPASRSVPTNSTDPVTITAKVVMKQGNELLGSGATATGKIQYRVYGTSAWNTGEDIEVESVDPALKYVIQNNTNFTVDVTKYLQEDKTVQIRLAIIASPAGEGTEMERYQTFSVTKVNISIAAEAFDYASVKSGNFQFNYRCYGVGIAKTVHFLLDGIDSVTPASIPANSANTKVWQQIIPMTEKENGMHTFQVYFVTSTGLESNRLNYFILYNTDSTREAPLIGAAAENTSIVDGDEIIVNYSVSTIGSEKTDEVEIELYTMDNGTKNSISTTTLTGVDNNVLASPPYRTFDYPSLKKNNPSDPDPDPITVYVKLTATHNGLSDSQTVSIQVRYLNTIYDLDPETNNLLFSYSAYGRSNNNANKDLYEYEYTRVNGSTLTFTGTFNNFNWSTDGYVDGESLIIGGGATLDIDVPIFNSKFNNISIEENDNIEKITTNGRTIEIDYEVLSTTNLGATIIDCMTTGASPKGFRVTPQNCYLLNSGSNIDIDDTGFIKNEENVAAAYLNPGTRTHLTFVIEPISTTLAVDNTYHQSVNIYINGEFANSCPYNVIGNDFDNNATITIGSDTCLIKLYSLKLYNRGLTEEKVLHNYAVSPVATREKLSRLEENDILDNRGQIDYEKARKKYTCLLLTGMGTVNGVAVPTMAPYKGYPSVVGRQKDGDTVGKTESGLLLTKPTTENTQGYTVEFDLQDKLIDPNNLYGYASSNNVQGTSSQKFPVKNLKIYLAKGDDENIILFDETKDISVKQVYKYSINTAAAAAYASVYGSEAALPTYITDCGKNIANIVKGLENAPTQAEVVTAIEEYLTAEDSNVGAAYSTYSTGDELVIHPVKAYKKSKKVKYALRDNGISESTLCWKADYMSTDHANTFNANIANTLYSPEDRLSDRWTDQTQFAVYGIKCLLFQQGGEGQPEFVGDGCLNNDKGNHTTFGLETGKITGIWDGDSDDNTMCQKWDFRNNTGSLLYFKHDGLFETIDGKPAIARELECIYPDEGDLADIGITPNYNHFQILSSWLGNRANYWYESNSTTRATKKQIFIDEFTNHFNLNHILIYYLFMEYTALCDNRVKNIHMRTDNAGLEIVKDMNGNIILNGNENPNSGPWTLAENLETRTMQEPIMDENGDYQFDQNGNMELGNISHVFVKDSVINNIDWQQGEGHSNFAIWAPVLYDLDSCFSADNVGYLKIRYDAEWNYSLYNKLKFAGFDSILWLQVEDCFQDELKVMAKKLYNRVVGLNYSTFYRQQITDNLASLCPAITNQDMILKYEKPWTEGFLDYTKDPPVQSKDKYKYLQRGTRTGQKAIFMKQRSLLLASKYNGNEFIQDKITFRAGTQVNYENSILTLVANQKLYPGAQFGDVNDTTKVTRRANKIYNSDNDTWVNISEDEWVPAFTPCQIQHSGNMNNTDGIEIYGASVLNDIGDISRFHPWQLKVGNAVNLKKLILGSDRTGYSNTSTDEIDGLNACALLEEINVCNLKNLTSLQLENNGFIKKVYATGSGLNTIALPRGGILDTIAYGENTTDITIINHSRLQHFSYENSDTNDYANVTRLWIENCNHPVYENDQIVGYECEVPIKEIITARLTPTSSPDHGLRAGGLRIIGLNLDLGNDSTFLKLLVSNLIKGTYLSASGGHVEGNNEYPVITGDITITSIRASLLAELNRIYPDLQIHVGTVQQEFTITYLDYNGAELYVDHGTNEDDLKDPVYDEDEVTHEPYMAMPIKPSDAQYIYRFGTYDNQNRYRKFSGWVRQGTTTNPTSGSKINGSITLVAYYPTKVLQQYTVTWYDGLNGQYLNDMTVNYGTDLSSIQSPIETGALSRVRSSGNGIQVFTGWSRPLGKIVENASVYALWQTSNISDATEDVTLSELTAADIYALSQVDISIKKNLLEEKLGDLVYIPMGHDFNYVEGVTTTNLLSSGEALELDGTADPVMVFNDIKPLSVNSDWTLAIDYKFLLNVGKAYFTGQEYVIASCYRNANSAINGFKVSLVRDMTSTGHHQIQVSWGTQIQTIDYACTDSTTSDDKLYFNSYRSMVVLSHNSDNPNRLRVSYVAPTLTNSWANNATTTGSNPNPYGSNYGTFVTTTNLDYESAALIDTPLILGGNYNGTTTTIENNDNYRKPAEGIIYWAKFWNTDLGNTNCAKLASWIHETVPFHLSGYNGSSEAKTTEQLYTGTNLSFVAAQGMGDKYIYSPTGDAPASSQDENGYFGWMTSNVRTICTNLIYEGLPEAYKSIMKYTEINTVARKKESKDLSITSYDYLFLPALREVDGTVDNQGIYGGEVNRQWTNPWSWMVSQPASHAANNVYEQATSGSNILKHVTKPVYMFLYRFLGHIIEPTARIFNTGAIDPLTISSMTYNNQQITVRSGDVWIRRDSNGSCAYMYFTNEDIAKGIKVQISATNGGWKQADIWNLRTINNANSVVGENSFMQVLTDGDILTTAGGTQNRAEPRLLCPEFTV